MDCTFLFNPTTEKILKVNENVILQPFPKDRHLALSLLSKHTLIPEKTDNK